MSHKLYLYPLVIRIWHAINAISILLLIFTGISIQYTDPSLPFMRFDLAITIHNYCGVVLIFSYILFFIANIVTGNVRQYYIKFKGLFGRLMAQAIYYSYGFFKGAEAPFPITEKTKFNPLQQIAYAAIMYGAVPVLIITGLGLLFPETVPPRIAGIGGIFFIDLLHIIAAFFTTVFLFIHLYFITMGKNPFKGFKSIVTGYHEDNH